MNKSIGERQKAAFKALKERGIDIRDVSEAIGKNMEFDKDGWYLGPKKKVVEVRGKTGNVVKLRHGGGFSAIGMTKTDKQCCGSRDCSNSFWTGALVGGLIGLLLAGG